MRRNVQKQKRECGENMGKIWNRDGTETGQRRDRDGTETGQRRDRYGKELKTVEEKKRQRLLEDKGKGEIE